MREVAQANSVRLSDQEVSMLCEQCMREFGGQDGITADGRAVNDPRVAPKPVGEVAVSTNSFALFSDAVAPAASHSGRTAARASNDPRGPLAPEAALQEAPEAEEPAAEAAQA